MNHNQAIKTFIADHSAEQVDFLAQLVKIPTDNPPGDCAHHGETVATLLEQKGFTVERHPVPAQRVHSVGMRSVTNLVVRQDFGNGPTVALNAHGDVVPPGEGWSHDPYGAEITDGRMFGRGVAVSKSDFATYTYALLALQASGATLNGTVELHFTYDEEVSGYVGPKWLLEEGISRPDYVICAGFCYGVVTHHNGCLQLEVRIHGKQAHAALPESGVDALEAATGVLNALYSQRKSYRARYSSINGIGSPALTVGIIQGGIGTNVVPDKVTLRLDRRMIPEEDPVTVEAQLRALIEQNACLPGVKCEIERVLLAEPLMPVVGVERLVDALCANAATILGESISSHGVPLFTDARHYAAAGIPTVLYGAGPRDILEANVHRADENLRLSDLHKATEIVARTLLDLLASKTNQES